MKNQLQVKDSDLEYSGENGRVFWSLPISSTVLIAEYTTNEGPQCDDYFLVFVTIKKDMFHFHTASFYSAGRDETLAALKQLLGSTFSSNLLAQQNGTRALSGRKKLRAINIFNSNLCAPRLCCKKSKKSC